MKTAKEILAEYNDVDLWCDIRNLQAIEKVIKRLEVLRNKQAGDATKDDMQNFQGLLEFERSLIN